MVPDRPPSASRSDPEGWRPPAAPELGLAESDSRASHEYGPAAADPARLGSTELEAAARHGGGVQDPDWLPLDGFDYLGRLGVGGMGIVFKAWQRSLDRPVAVKTVRAGLHASDKTLARFRVEVQAVAQLQHPNIVHIFHVDEWQSRPYFVMEFVEGRTLAALLAERTLPPAEAARLIEPVARAMHYSHLRGVVHRDLKPSNILLDEGTSGTGGPVPKVADFGLAKRLSEEFGLTEAEDRLGTPAYMAPEQTVGRHGDVGPATDVYALGVILYECLTGRVPTVDRETGQVVSPAFHVSSLPADLETVVLKCLRERPADRYETALDLADDLARFLAGEPIKARPMSRLERARHWLRARPRLVAAAAAAAVVAVGAAAYLDAFVLPRHSYYAGFTKRHGAPEGLVPVSGEQFAHRQKTYRFTRRGRFGRVERVDIVDSAGRPTIDDTATLWLDGVRQNLPAAGTPNAARPAGGGETTRPTLDPAPLVQDVAGTNGEGLSGAGAGDRLASSRGTLSGFSFTYAADGSVASEAAYDVEGKRILQFDYIPLGDDGRYQGRTAMARFVRDGRQLADKSGANLVAFERTEDGFDEVVRFYHDDETGREPRPDAGGAYGYRLVGHPAIRRVERLGKGGALSASDEGVAVTEIRYRPDGLEDGREFQGPDRKPLSPPLECRTRNFYDEWGNLSHTEYYDRDGRLVRRVSVTPDRRNWVWLVKSISFEAEGPPGVVASETEAVVDPRNLVISSTLRARDGTRAEGFNRPDGTLREARFFYPDGDVSVRSFDAAGEVYVLEEVRHPDGTVTRREFDPKGRQSREAYLAADGRPRQVGDGFTELTWDFGPDDSLAMTYRGYAGYGGFVSWVRRLDVKGRIVEDRALDGQGRPADSMYGFASKRVTYRPDGEIDELVYTDSKGRTIPPPAIRAVSPDGPAWRAGVRVGDRFVSYDGQPVSDILSLIGVRDAAAKSRPGGSVKLVVLRGGERRTFLLPVGPIGIGLDPVAAPKPVPAGPAEAPKAVTRQGD